MNNKPINHFTSNLAEMKWVKETDEILAGFKDEVPILGALTSKSILRDYDKQDWQYRSGGRIPKILQAKDSSFRYALDWFDHHGTLSDSVGHKRAIIEPYGHMDIERMKELIAFCEERDLWCYIDPESPHYPTLTLLIVFGENKEKK